MWIIRTMGKDIASISMQEMLNFVYVAKKEGYDVDPPVEESTGIFVVVVHSREKSCTPTSPSPN